MTAIPQEQRTFKTDSAFRLRLKRSAGSARQANPRFLLALTLPAAGGHIWGFRTRDFR